MMSYLKNNQEECCMENYAEESNDLFPSELLPVQLPNGGEIYVRTQIVDSESNVAIPRLDFDLVRQSIEGIAEVVKDGLKGIKPSKTSVELAFEMGLKSNKLIAILVEGSGKASIKVTLEWDSKDNESNGA